MRSGIITEKEKEKQFQKLLENGAKIIEVTVKQLYITYPHEPMTEQQIKDEWFGTHMNRSHAYRDGSKVGNADEIVDIKFLKLNSSSKRTKKTKK